jgi:RNA polymerase sigma-70 factor (ECF subfamily)
VDERTLIDRCLAGDEDAWRSLLGTYDPVIRTLARLVLRSLRRPADDAEIEEVRSGVLEMLLADGSRVLRSFRWQCSFESWLRVLVRTVSIRAVRRKKIDPREVSGPAAPAAPLDRLLSEERSRVVREALSQMPPREQKVLTLFFIEGQSYQEISSATGLPMGTIATVLARSRDTLREMLKARGI